MAGASFANAATAQLSAVMGVPSAMFVTATGKVLPLAKLLVKFVTVQLSLALMKKMTLLLLQRPGSAANTKLLEQVSIGFCVSKTVTVNVQLLTLPLASVTVLVTVVTPTGKVLPLAMLLVKFETVQLSCALTKKVTLLLLHWPGSAANTKLLAQAITGFCVSKTVTVKV